MPSRDTKSDLETFETNPSLFLEKCIKEFVAANPKNRLELFDNDPIFDEPLVGFADGDDAIFRDYKEIIGNFHLTPREALGNYQSAKDNRCKLPARVSIVSWILPVAYKTRLSMRRESIVPSLRWNYTRFQGQELIDELSLYMVSLLQNLGYQAVNPELTDLYKITAAPGGLVSNWSHRHIAYAAGLGTFGLSDSFITSRGVAIRCGSMVTSAALTPSPRLYTDHHANCIFYQGKSCQRCAERCPASAISEQGHNKIRCHEFLLNEQKNILKELGRDAGFIGRYPGCGLCQTKVPCEDRIPLSPP